MSISDPDNDGRIELYADGELVLAGRQTGDLELLGGEVTTRRGERYRLEKVLPEVCLVPHVRWVWWRGWRP